MASSLWYFRSAMVLRCRCKRSALQLKEEATPKLPARLPVKIKVRGESYCLLSELPLPLWIGSDRAEHVHCCAELTQCCAKRAQCTVKFSTNICAFFGVILPYVIILVYDESKEEVFTQGQPHHMFVQDQPIIENIP